MTSAAHDPGGKVRLKMPKGMVGDAVFAGPNDCYRPLLSRRWSAIDGRFMLWIGCNPSTAAADVDDPTIRREVDYTMRLGYNGYVKCNVADFRATKPKSLAEPAIQPISDLNRATILNQASQASLIVLAWGAVPKRIEPAAVELDRTLHSLGYKTYCLGFTKTGHPRHPLYMPKSAELVEFWPNG